MSQRNLPGRFLRTNYRLTGGAIDVGDFQSQLLLLSLGDCGQGTYSWDANPHTISMAGYGKPAWIGVVGVTMLLSDPGSATMPVYFWATQSFSGSIGWLYGFQSDGLLSTTINIQVLALIASR